MNELNPASSFKEAAQPNEHLSIDRAILAWFEARGTGWQAIEYSDFPLAEITLYFMNKTILLPSEY